MPHDLISRLERAEGRWQKQTLFFDPDIGGGGNCTEAALASMFNVSLAEIPQFHPMRDEREDPTVVGEFWRNFERWLESKGFIAIRFDRDPKFDCLYLASGMSSRGCLHMVVYRAGELIHDPHPSDEGINSVEDAWVLIPRDIAALRAREKGEG